ncbi:MAG: acetate--CoA ligase family protein, partial [bacterium]|nr:acetate--CoA ligase family protein [bacterium]
GARAAASHTGSLAGSDSAYDAIFFQSGIQRVDSINELLDYAAAFAKQPVPKGKRIAIVTNAGGPGIMATDAAIRQGLEIAELSEATKEKLKRDLPPTASISNPVDIIGDATHERYEASIRHILLDENVDGALVILTPQAMTDIVETAAIVPKASELIDKPVLCSFMGIVDVSEGIKLLEKNGYPNYTFPEEAVRSMASMVRFSDHMKFGDRNYVKFDVDKDKVAGIIKEKLKDHQSSYLSQREANVILGHYGFPVLKNQLITDSSQIAKAAEQIGYPVVMKIMSPDIVHKYDVGGVILNIENYKDAKEAYETIIKKVKAYKADAKIDGVLLEKMAKKGVEVILGAFKDPKFGPICMFGLGGTYV